MSEFGDLSWRTKYYEGLPPARGRLIPFGPKDKPCEPDPEERIMSESVEATECDDKLRASIAEVVRRRSSYPPESRLVDQIMNAIAAFAQPCKVRNVMLKSLIRDFVDVDACVFDHDDFCQTHYRYKPCPHETARELLGIQPRPARVHPGDKP